MSTINYTPIDDRIKKLRLPTVSLPKETEPALIRETEIKEDIEYELEKEVSPFIQKRAETIKLPPDLKKIGLQTPSIGQFSNYQNIKLPISDDKIVTGLHSPVTSSLRWLATLALYILRQAHLGLKVVHGRVIRIIRR